MNPQDSMSTDFPRITPPLRFTLRQVECFLGVAEHGSISRAAFRLNSSESTIADAISGMERSLGTKLFNRRRSHGATLTSDGRTILPLARQILADGAELTAAVGHDVDSIVGPVRIGCSPTLASTLLPRLITETAQRFPGIQIEYMTDDLGPMLEKTDNAELDLVASFDIGMPPEYESVTLSTTEAMLVVSDEHHLANRDAIELPEVANEPMVLMDVLSSRTHTLELMSSVGVKPRIRYRTDDYELCRAMVGRGLGYTLLMRRPVPLTTWDGGSVVYIPITPAPRIVEVLLAWPRGSLPPRVKAVIQCATVLGEAYSSGTKQ